MATPATKKPAVKAQKAPRAMKPKALSRPSALISVGAITFDRRAAMQAEK
jgi:hypothetical protein